MSDTQRLDPEAARATADRDGRTEALLVEGLDRYFAGDFEDAIHVWTRVLFLDRSHARARAYIDRARTALGERQRRADEMLQATAELIGSADLGRARSVLSQAARTSGDDERVARLWSELERAERARPATTPVAARSASGVASIPIWRPAPGVVGTFLAAGALGALLMALAISPAVREWAGGGVAPDSTSTASRVGPPVVLGSEDVALLRARTLYERGRLAEALRALDRVSSIEARGVADALRVEIQTALLSAAGDVSSVTADTRSKGLP